MQLQYNYTTLHYTTLHHTNYMTYYNYNYNCNYDYRDIALHYTTLMKLHELHYTTLQLQLHYFTQHYNIPHYTTTTTTLITPHHSYNYNCSYTTLTTLHYSYNSTTLHHNYSYNCATPNYIQQLWWGDHCNHCNYSKNHSSNHLSVHQWIYSAIPWFATTNLSYRSPIFETSATALCSTTGNIDHFGRDGFPVTNGEVAQFSIHTVPIPDLRAVDSSVHNFANVRMMILWERRDRPNWDALAAVLSDGFTGTPYISQISLFSLADLKFLDQFFVFKVFPMFSSCFWNKAIPFSVFPTFFPPFFSGPGLGRGPTDGGGQPWRGYATGCIPTPRWSAPRSTSPQSRQAGRSPMR